MRGRRYRRRIGRYPLPAPVLVALVVLASACTGEPAEGGATVAPPTTASDAVDSTSRTSAPETTVSVGTPTTAAGSATTLPGPVPASEMELVAFPVPPGSRPHDVAPAVDGGVWYTAQGSGELGWLDPLTGETRHIGLGTRSRPHGVIVGPDGAAWITDGGLNAILRVDPATDEIVEFPLPPERPDANLNTAAFDSEGRLWFTGQSGIHGVLDPVTGEMEVFDSPRGRGPYGIAATPTGQIYYASLAGSYIGKVTPDGSVTVLEPPTPAQGARRVWSDSTGAIWVSEWNSGRLSRYVPSEEKWTTWPLPGDQPQAYAVYVDETDIVWVSDFGGNAILRFDPATETFYVFALPSNPGNVRQILGKPGEIWGAESAADQLIVIRRATG